MSHGIFLRGDNSSVLVTSTSKTIVFLGKATFVSRQGIGGNFPPYYVAQFGQTLYNWPISALYNYTFNAGSRTVIYFVENTYPNKCSVIGVSKNSGVDTINIASQPAGTSSYIPAVYAFAETNTTQTSGYGFNIFTELGAPAFSTQDNILLANKIYQFSGQPSNLQETRIGSLYYVGNGPNTGATTISTVAPVATDGVGITKPILYFPAPESAVFRGSVSQQRFFYELAASYNPSTTNLEVEWVNTFFQSSSPIVNYNVPSQNNFAMVVDGALYD